MITKFLAFLPILDGMIGSGLITLEKVKVLRYRSTLDHARLKPLAFADSTGSPEVPLHPLSRRRAAGRLHGCD